MSELIKPNDKAIKEHVIDAIERELGKGRDIVEILHQINIHHPINTFERFVEEVISLKFFEEEMWYI